MFIIISSVSNRFTTKTGKVLDILILERTIFENRYVAADQNFQILFNFHQVESQGQHIINTPSKDVGGMFHTQAWNDIVSAEQSEKMQKVLDTSVDQIAGVCCHIQTPFQNINTLLWNIINIF